jgi:hypothetical protein
VARSVSRAETDFAASSWGAGSRLRQFGEDVRIDEVAGHRAISRPGSADSNLPSPSSLVEHPAPNLGRNVIIMTMLSSCESLAFDRTMSNLLSSRRGIRILPDVGQGRLAWELR